MSKQRIADRALYHSGIELDDVQIDALLKAGGALTSPFESGNKAWHVLPEGYTVHPIDLTKDQPTPDRKRGKATMRDVESLIAYVIRHRIDGTAVYVDGLRVTAYLNGHEPDMGKGGDFDGAGWGDHIATFEPKYTPGWTAWTGFSGNWIEQRDFANFLENRIPEIANPNGADVLEAITNLRIKYDTHYEKLIETTNDLVQLVWREEAEVGQIRVPTKLDLYLRMFEGGESYALSCRVRFQKPDQNGKVKFRFELGEELHDIELKAQQDLRSKLVAGVGDGVPIFVGTWAQA